MRRLLIGLALLVAAVALFLALAFPWGPIRGLEVEQATVLDASGRDAAPRIAVTFSVPTDLETLRADKDAGFINAVLSACDDDDMAVRENIAQRDGYFGPGRVRKLAASGTARVRYRVEFDGSLPTRDGAQIGMTPAATVPGGLCFALSGGSMWAGKLWSDSVRVRLAR